MVKGTMVSDVRADILLVTVTKVETTAVLEQSIRPNDGPG